MNNSNYSIGLQRLKPIHTAYCGLHNLAKNWSWARDVNGRDQDETEMSASRDWDETLVWDVETETTTLPTPKHIFVFQYFRTLFCNVCTEISDIK